MMPDRARPAARPAARLSPPSVVLPFWHLFRSGIAFGAGAALGAGCLLGLASLIRGVLGG